MSFVLCKWTRWFAKKKRNSNNNNNNHVQIRRKRQQQTLNIETVYNTEAKKKQKASLIVYVPSLHCSVLRKEFAVDENTKKKAKKTTNIVTISIC